MRLSRREALQLGAATAAGGLLSGCGPVARQFATDIPDDVSLPKANVEPTARLVNRLSYGPTPGELQRVASIGHAKYLQEQFAATQEEPLHLQAQLHQLDVLRMDAVEMTELPRERVLQQLQQAAILRAAYSPNQLRERMVEFWSDHFNIYARKELGAWMKGPDDTQVIRKHALGNFYDLLQASAHSPAMLIYLDNQVNKKGQPNENYARELMELHTLGVHGGYSQTDVQEVARCFSGWAIEDRFLRPRGKFRFIEEIHDDGTKTVLGERLPAGGGQEDGERVLQILVSHPSTAKHLATKLCRWFLGHEEERVVSNVASTYLSAKGDIRSVLRTLFSGPYLEQAPPVAKRPFDFIISAIRSVGAITDGGRGVQEHLERMGQPVHQWPMPDGYPTKPEAWTGSMLARWNFALALARGEVSGTSADVKELGKKAAGQVTAVVLGGKHEDLQRRIGKHAATPQEQVAMALASPDFQWR